MRKSLKAFVPFAILFLSLPACSITNNRDVDSIVSSSSSELSSRESETLSSSNYSIESISETLECIHHWHHYPKHEPNCSENGVKEFWYCDKCHSITLVKPTENDIENVASKVNVEINDERYIAPLNHDYGEEEIIIPPTISSEGLKQTTCSRCQDVKQTVIPRLTYDEYTFNDINYKIKSGKATLFNDGLRVNNGTLMAVNENASFESGHISFNVDSNNQTGDNGIVYALEDNNATSYIDGTGITYYFLFIANGYVRLSKSVNGAWLIISSSQLLYYTPTISYDIDLYYDSGHTICYVNNQLFIDYFDENPLQGNRYGFRLDDVYASISDFDIDDDVLPNNYIDLSKNNVLKYGSIPNPEVTNTARASMIHREKVKEGTIVRFVGDTSIYKWALIQIVDDSVDFTRKESRPYRVDSGWNINGGFGGSDIITSAMSIDGYIGITIAHIDDSVLYQYEIDAIPSMFVAEGEVSTGHNKNVLAKYSDVTLGNMFSWTNTSRATIRVMTKLEEGTTISFLGDTNTYRWAVLERAKYYGDDADALEIKDYTDSYWNNDSIRSTNFSSDGKSYTLATTCYIDIELAYVDNRAITLDLDSLYSMFSVEGDDWGAIQNNRSRTNSVNHRGYSTDAPENTLSAYRLSKEKGFYKVETDVSMTSDGVPVLLHDNTIDRTSNGSGNITSISFDEVRGYDFGSWKDIKYAGEKIPTLDEFIALCKELDLHPYIELKDSTPVADVARCVEIVNKYEMIRQCTWIAFSANRLAAVHFYDVKARLGHLTIGEFSFNMISTVFSLKGPENESFLDSNHEDANKNKMVRMTAVRNVPLEVWTIDDVNVVNNLNVYISGVTSNWIIAEDLFS